MNECAICDCKCVKGLCRPCNDKERRKHGVFYVDNDRFTVLKDWEYEGREFKKGENGRILGREDIAGKSYFKIHIDGWDFRETWLIQYISPIHTI